MREKCEQGVGWWYWSPDIITDRMAFLFFSAPLFSAAFAVLYDYLTAPQTGRLVGKGLENIKVVVKNMLNTCLCHHIRVLYF